MQIELEGIQKTLLMPLWGRAMISKEKNSFFMDSKAIELIEKLDFDFSKIDATIPEAGNISTVVRAKTIDNKIKEFLAIYPKATIIDLGAGLETAFYRVNNNLVTWYDIDLPDVINIRKTLLPETEHSFYISDSIFDMNWVKNIISSISNGILFISTGVLEYFNQNIVLKFITDLATLFPGAEIIFNTSSNNKLSSFFTKRTLKKMDITANTAVCGNGFINNFIRNSDRIELVDRFKLFSKIDLKSYFNKKILRNLRYFELFSPSYIVHLKFKENNKVN